MGSRRSRRRRLEGGRVDHGRRLHALAARRAGGPDVPVGENVLLGVSAHRRRGSAEVSHDGGGAVDGEVIRKGGDIKTSGNGVGVSGSWFRDDVYVDIAATTTWYKSDLTSRVRGPLRRDVSALGHALGVEAGRRVALDDLPGGAFLTSRVGLAHSRISMSDFIDTIASRDVRVSLNDGRSLKARVGARLETEIAGPRNGHVFGSLDLERETSAETRVTVSGTELTASGKETWVRLGLGGALRGEWHTLRGTAGYAAGGGGAHEYGAGLELNVRF